jgi:hypothetical protein
MDCWSNREPAGAGCAILLALDTPDLLCSAAVKNAMLVAKRAGVDVVREQVRLFYEALHASREIPK